MPKKKRREILKVTSQGLYFGMTRFTILVLIVSIAAIGC